VGTGEGMSLSARPGGAVAAEVEVVVVTDEAEEFTAFYQREYRGMLRLALALASNRGVAEELTQEAFLTLLVHWGSVREMDHPRAWVRRVLSNRQRRTAGGLWWSDGPHMRSHQLAGRTIVRRRCLGTRSTSGRRCAGYLGVKRKRWPCGTQSICHELKSPRSWPAQRKQ